MLSSQLTAESIMSLPVLFEEDCEGDENEASGRAVAGVQTKATGGIVVTGEQAVQAVRAVRSAATPASPASASTVKLVLTRPAVQQQQIANSSGVRVLSPAASTSSTAAQPAQPGQPASQPVKMLGFVKRPVSVPVFRPLVRALQPGAVAPATPTATVRVRAPVRPGGVGLPGPPRLAVVESRSGPRPVGRPPGVAGPGRPLQSVSGVPRTPRQPTGRPVGRPPKTPHAPTGKATLVKAVASSASGGGKVTTAMPISPASGAAGLTAVPVQVTTSLVRHPLLDSPFRSRSGPGSAAVQDAAGAAGASGAASHQPYQAQSSPGSPGPPGARYFIAPKRGRGRAAAAASASRPH